MSDSKHNRESIINNQCPACGAEGLEYPDAIIDESQMVYCTNVDCVKSWNIEYDMTITSVEEMT